MEVKKRNREFIPDISEVKLQEHLLLESPSNLQLCHILKQQTPARLCEGRAGDRYKTETYLRLRADHALAIDAVWTPMNESILEPFNFLKINTLIQSRDEYLRFPEKGRRFTDQTLAELKKKCIQNADVQIIVTDGLSATAIEANLANMYPILLEGIQAHNWILGTPIFVKYGRVASMDRISEVLTPKVTVLLVGERPGLSGGGESMSCYLAYEAKTTKPESQRTVIANIHAHGLPAVEAGAQIVYLIRLMLEQRTSGVNLKI
jgi:ethanolamine ammonia-lyase small subunit